MAERLPVDVKRAADALLEMTPDFEHGGGKVTSPQGPLKKLSVEQVAPNIVLFYEEKGNFFKPAGWIMLYFLDSEQAAKDMKDNKVGYPMFVPGSLSMRFSGYSMIDAIWKKRKPMPNETPADAASREAMIHVIGALEAYKTAEGLFVDNISVRPGWRKNSIGSKMMQALENHFPGLPMTHSETTDAGHKFLKKTGHLKHSKAARGGEHLSGPATDAVIEALLEESDDSDTWIGVDFDGTLAKHTSGKYHPTRLGDPIPKMVARVRRWVGHGKKVKIFTARADDERSVNAIKKWLKDNELPDLEITNLKDRHMKEFWDDRAVAVRKNTGEVKESVVDFLLGEDDLAETIIGKDIPPAYARIGDDDDEEIANASRQPFTAMDLALRRNQHHPKLWAVIKGSPYEREYLRRFNPTENLSEERRVNPEDMHRALDFLRRRNPAGYAQMLLLPFGPVPSYAMEDESSDWWASEEAFARLADARRGATEGVKPMRENLLVTEGVFLLESPEIKTLKKNSRSLDPEERAQVMKARAVWHHGPNGEATPAVRKAVVNGKTWYWCATHRAGQVKPTLKGAIRAFDFVKTTA